MNTGCYGRRNLSARSWTRLKTRRARTWKRWRKRRQLTSRNWPRWSMFLRMFVCMLCVYGELESEGRVKNYLGRVILRKTWKQFKNREKKKKNPNLFCDRCCCCTILTSFKCATIRHGLNMLSWNENAANNLGVVFLFFVFCVLFFSFVSTRADKKSDCFSPILKAYEEVARSYCICCTCVCRCTFFLFSASVPVLFSTAVAKPMDNNKEVRVKLISGVMS